MSDHPKVLLIWDSLGPYHHARIKALIALVGRENVAIACMGKVDTTYLWENPMTQAYKIHYLSKREVHQSDFFYRLYNAFKLIKRERITHIAQPGFARAEYLCMLLLARFFGKEVIFFAESWYSKSYFLDQFKGFLIRNTVHKMFVSGVRSERYYHQACKIPSKLIETGYSVVDNQHFAKVTPPIRLNKPYILVVARYSEEKNLKTLISAYKASLVYQQWYLVLVGDGPQRAELESMIDNDADWILLEGWKTYAQLPAWYQGAEVFILPSTFEPWGLVVNEALAAGCPTLVSDSCGCVDDLLGVDAPFVFKASSSEQLTTLINRIANRTRENKSKTVENNKRVLNYTCATWAKKLVTCLK